MGRRTPRTRREFLALGVATGTSALAGCSSFLGGKSNSTKPTLDDFRGSNPLVGARETPDAPTMAALPDLEGSLTLYVAGGAAGRYAQLVSLIERRYPSFQVDIRVDTPSALVDALRREDETGNVRADVFWATSAGALGAVEEAGLTASLPGDVREQVSPRFAPTTDWIGLGGVVRALAYNPRTVVRADVPNAIEGVPRTRRTIAWAPRTPSFRSFVTGLRHRSGLEAARDWLTSTLERRTVTASDEVFAADAVARGDAAIAAVNHTDVLRVRAGGDARDLGLAFTENDAGTMLDAPSAGVLRATENRTLATRFVRHLLSAEAQEFLATRALTYPAVPGISPVDVLPSLDSLSLPGIPLTVLADTGPTDALLHDVGVLP